MHDEPEEHLPWTETGPKHHLRNPKFRRGELRQERDWCLAEIEVARNGGHCEPHTQEEWMKMMQKRAAILNDLIRDR